MDLKFIQLIDDLTKDGWKLSTNPMALEIQKDSDFIENIKYMSIKTKVCYLSYELLFNRFTYSFNLPFAPPLMLKNIKK